MYNYHEQREKLFTEEGQRTFLKIRDRVNKLLETSGAATMDQATRKTCASGWTAMACVDRMVELKELHEIKQVGDVMGQNRIFVKP